ncbi:MAG: membrane protein insertase YidC [Myxococcota bacterium]
MDRNFFLALALSFLVLVSWSMWQAEDQEIPPGDHRESPVPRHELPASPQADEITAETDPAPVRAVPSPAAPETIAIADAREVIIETPLYRAQLTSRGGALTGWQLSEFRDAQQAGNPPVELTTLVRGEAALATPLAGLGGGDLRAARFDFEQSGPWELVFQREFDGVHVRKVYRFDPDSYLVRLLLEVDNQSSRAVEPEFEVTWPARSRDAQDFANQVVIALAQGSVERSSVEGFGQPGMMSRLLGQGDGGGPIDYSGELDWAGASTQYFLAVLLPDVPRDARVTFKPLSDGQGALAKVGFRPTLLPPGQQLVREYRAYLGPKEDERLAAVGAQLERSIDRGWAWIAPLTAFFSWLLRATHAVVPNYGVSIILITIAMRLITAPLMSKQMRSMRGMGELQPRMKEIQAKYADDRQKQSEAMMKLYRQSGVNPLGGCLPMLLQLPVFIGLYYALQSSIELRQAPFMLWINDLSAPETLFTIPELDLPVRVLPLLMGASMVLQQRLTPTTIDPAQARMMMTVMPVMFTVMFYRFPSGLVLYWFVSNLLGIVHQLSVNRGGKKPGPAKAPKPAKKATETG